MRGSQTLRRTGLLNFQAIPYSCTKIEQRLAALSTFQSINVAYC
jgi:hypothetical protein